jgi:SAM-dependent methyltransferase
MSVMKLEETARNWEAFAKMDPLWAILTVPGKEGGRWSIEEFFAAGRAEIAGVLKEAGALGLPERRERALDFGCGVGRLTQALATEFARCDGVDIAPSMIAQARALDRSGGRCVFHLNARADLGAFPDGAFDLVYSNVVLQHVAPRYARRYLEEFARVLRPGGLGVFQLPSAMRLPWRLLRPLASARAAWRRLRGGQPVMEMHGVPVRTVRRALERAGARVLRVDADGAAGPMWHGHRYWFTGR